MLGNKLVLVYIFVHLSGDNLRTDTPTLMKLCRRVPSNAIFEFEYEQNRSSGCGDIEVARLTRFSSPRATSNKLMAFNSFLSLLLESR